MLWSTLHMQGPAREKACINKAIVSPEGHAMGLRNR